MNNLERYGIELALLIRRRDAARAAWDDAAAKIEAVCKRISDEPAGTLYGQTGEQPAVPVSPVSGSWSNERAREVPAVRNAGPIPYRPDKTDGGSTFRLTPIGDAVEPDTEKLPAVVPCPRTAGGDRASCLALEQHFHTADGEVHAIASL